MLAQDDESRLSTLFGALGNAVRIKIISIVEETRRPLHIKAIARILGMDYAAVYRHVEVLKTAGLVQIFDVGRSRVVTPSRSETLKQIFALARQMLA